MVALLRLPSRRAAPQLPRGAPPPPWKAELQLPLRAAPQLLGPLLPRVAGRLLGKEEIEGKEEVALLEQPSRGTALPLPQRVVPKLPRRAAEQLPPAAALLLPREEEKATLCSSMWIRRSGRTSTRDRVDDMDVEIPMVEMVLTQDMMADMAEKC